MELQKGKQGFRAATKVVGKTRQKLINFCQRSLLSQELANQRRKDTSASLHFIWKYI